MDAIADFFNSRQFYFYFIFKPIEVKVFFLFTSLTLPAAKFLRVVYSRRSGC